ncbi:hypothetical protein M3Y97_00323800 [Aphelenchoides bicaudatus]|nr:hypothetical protein M3Y97_00323800 [Aphelenchoides bicaudatus]
MAAASYRQSSPIIGFMGHLPGAKFHVGSRLMRAGTAYPGALSRRSQRSISKSRRGGNEDTELNGDVAASVAGYNFDDDGNPIPRETRASFRNGVSQLGNSQNGGGASPVFQIPVQFVHTQDASAASLQIPVHPNMIDGQGKSTNHINLGAQTIGNRTAITASRSMHDLANNTDRLSIHNDADDELVVGSRRSQRSNDKKRRSKSAATTKTKKTADWQGAELNGAGGWWSEGQALRNLRRHREINGLPPYTAAQPTSELQTQRTPKTGRQSRVGTEIDGNEINRTQTSVERLGRTPAPGYTGHLIEMHRLQIGKNFTDAAKESRKLQQSYRESLNGSFMTTRSHSPRKRSPSVRNATQQSRRSHN